MKQIKITHKIGRFGPRWVIQNDGIKSENHISFTLQATILTFSMELAKDK